MKRSRSMGKIGINLFAVVLIRGDVVCRLEGGKRTDDGRLDLTAHPNPMYNRDNVWG